MQRTLPAATPAILYARIQKWCELHPQSYMLEFKAEMSAAEVTNLHPKPPNHAQTQPREFSDCTPTPVDVPMFSDIPIPTCNELCQLRRPHSYVLDFKNGATSARIPIY